MSEDEPSTPSTRDLLRNDIYPPHRGWDEEIHTMVSEYLLRCKEANVRIPSLTEIQDLAPINKADYSRLINGAKLTKKGTHSEPYKRLKHLCTIEKPHLESATNRGTYSNTAAKTEPTNLSQH